MRHCGSFVELNVRRRLVCCGYLSGSSSTGLTCTSASDHTVTRTETLKTTLSRQHKTSQACALGGGQWRLGAVRSVLLIA